MDKEQIKRHEEERREWQRTRYFGGPAFHWVPKWKRWLIGFYIIFSGLLLLVMLASVLNRLSGIEIALLAIGISSVPAFVFVSREEQRFYRVREMMQQEDRD